MNRLIAFAAGATLAVSTAEIVRPDLVMRALGAPSDEVTATTRTMVRAFGARNFTLGAMLLTPAGRAGIGPALPVFVAAELAALGMAATSEEGPPVLPALGGAATLALIAVAWRGIRQG